jgi:DNA topoisomerase-2
MASQEYHANEITEDEWHEQMRKKAGMWIGSKEMANRNAFALDEEGKIVVGTYRYPLALVKIIDEIVVNAVDISKKCEIGLFGAKRVTKIIITVFKDGVIEVKDNGPGIAIKKGNIRDADGHRVYAPQAAYSRIFTGSNLNTEDDSTRIVGGQNGVGAKATTVYSTMLRLFICDGKKIYKQTFRNGVLDIGEPKIQDAPKNAKTFMSVKFRPDYTHFGIKNPEEFIPTILPIIHARAIMASVSSGVEVFFNSESLKYSFREFCELFPSCMEKPTVIHARLNDLYDWKFAIIPSSGKLTQFSLINGVIVKNGTHYDYVMSHLLDGPKGIKAKLEKELKSTKSSVSKVALKNAICMIFCGNIPDPNFGGQTKDELQNNPDNFETNLEQAEVDRCWRTIKDYLIAVFTSKALGKKKVRANRSRIDAPDYIEAHNCRHKTLWQQCGLILTEGASASGTANAALQSPEVPEFTTKNFGVYSLQGVIVNALKESIEAKTGQKLTDYPPRRIPKSKISNNKILANLMKIIGLDFNATYDFTPEGEKEWNTLRYGFVAGLTDQDLDGFNIFGLLCTFFMVYWPPLFDRGFVRRVFTPLIRAYPKGDHANRLVVEEFEDEKERDEWLARGNDASKYEMRYYKGLGSHRQQLGEVTRMFQDIQDKIRPYVYDAKKQESFQEMEVYYGTDTTLRKRALSTPVVHEAIPRGMEIPLSFQFKIHTKDFQLDNINRKLIAIADGFIEGRRKIFFVARKYKGREFKVHGLAGKAADEADYHHGETSVENTIVWLAQAFPEARKFPLLLPLGNFGNRPKGYKDYAQSRYIYTILNHRLTDKLFIKEDDWILDYAMSDGKRYEPKRFAPIIPYALCESHEIPATGWRITTYARRFDDLMKNVRRMIKGKISQCGTLRMDFSDLPGEIRVHRKINYYVGCYEYDEEENAVVITALSLHPSKRWSYVYLRGSDEKKQQDKTAAQKSGMINKEWVHDFEDHTSNDKVHIVLYLKEGAKEAIEEWHEKTNKTDYLDAFENYFELSSPVYDRLNLIANTGEVVECKSYEQIFDTWFEYRKQLYGVRIERSVIQTKLKIEMLEEMQRFSRLHDSYHIGAGMTREERDEILLRENYKKLDKSLIENPKYVSVDELEFLAKEGPGAKWKYLLEMNYGTLGKEKYEEREKELKDLRRKLEEKDDTPFVGARTWLKELDELEKVYLDGVERKWNYTNQKYKFAGKGSVKPARRGGKAKK